MLLILAHFSVFILAAVVLSISAIYLVRTLIQIGILIKLPEFSISFILIAVATSLPELSVGISAALEKEPILSLGTVIGSNIADLTLIIGLPALIAKGIRIESKVRNRDIFYVTVLSIIPLVLLLDGTLSKTDGVVLILLFLFYLFRLLVQQEKYTKKLDGLHKNHSLFNNSAHFLLEILALILSAHLLVKTASFIAQDLKIPLVLVGLIVVALGTSLPELSFELYTIYKRQSGLALGNILGSIVTNSCLILGITSIIYPIEIIDGALFFVSATFWILVLLLFITFLRSQYKLSRKEGIVLIFVYALFIVVTFSIESGPK